MTAEEATALMKRSEARIAYAALVTEQVTAKLAQMDATVRAVSAALSVPLPDDLPQEAHVYPRAEKRTVRS